MNNNTTITMNNSSVSELRFNKLLGGDIIATNGLHDFTFFVEKNGQLMFAKRLDRSIEPSYLDDFHDKSTFTLYTLRALQESHLVDKLLIRHIESRINELGFIRASGDIVDRVRILNAWSDKLSALDEGTSEDIENLKVIANFLSTLMNSSVKSLVKINMTQAQKIMRHIARFGESKIQVPKKKQGVAHMKRIVRAFEPYFLHTGDIKTVSNI